MTAGAVRAVLLDLDGTLVDSVADIAHAIDATLQEAGLPMLGIDGTRPLVGKGAMNLVARALATVRHAEPSDADVEAMHAAFIPNYRKTNGRYSTVYDGVFEGLDLMRAAGFALGCVTNKPREMAAGLLAAMKLDHYFAVLVAGGDTERKKPDPQPVLLACERLGAAPLQTVMIGDSANDADAARRAGCEVWLVPYGYSEGRAIETVDSDWIVPTLVDAARLLTQAR
ncbi:phosphoglycolate phosphatase [soil metagenome]